MFGVHSLITREKAEISMGLFWEQGQERVLCSGGRSSLNRLVRWAWTPGV